MDGSQRQAKSQDVGPGTITQPRKRSSRQPTSKTKKKANNRAPTPLRPSPPPPSAALSQAVVTRSSELRPAPSLLTQQMLATTHQQHQPLQWPIVGCAWDPGYASTASTTSTMTMTMTTNTPVETSSAEARDEQSQQKNKRARTGSAGPATTTVVQSLISVLMRDMQDMQRSVGAMKHDVLQLSAAQASMSYAQDDMRHALETLPLAMTIGHALQKCSLSRSRPLTSSSSSFSWSSSSSSSSSTSPRSALTTFTSFDGSRLASLFPFLADFRLHQRNVPFAIDDVSKPMGAICPIEKPPKKGGKPHDLWHPPRRKPVLALFNQAFCDMLQYQAHELQGSSIAHFMLPDPDPEVQHQFMTRMMARTFGDVGDVVPISPRMRTKDGRLIRAEVKHQSFFSAEGRLMWSVICVDSTAAASWDELPPDFRSFFEDGHHHHHHHPHHPHHHPPHRHHPHHHPHHHHPHHHHPHHHPHHPHPLHHPPPHHREGHVPCFLKQRGDGGGAAVEAEPVSGLDDEALLAALLSPSMGLDEPSYSREAQPTTLAHSTIDRPAE